jgi:hypothetical protein
VVSSGSTGRADVDGGGQQQPAGREPGDRDHRGHDQKVPGATYRQRRGNSAQPGAEAMHGVHARQDRPAVALLNGHAVGVHRHRGHVHGGGQHERRRGERGQAGGQPGTSEQDGQRRQRHGECRPAARPGDQDAAELKAGQRARLQANQGDSELAVAQAQIGFYRRQPRRPGEIGQAHQPERQARSNAGATQPL